MPPVPPASAAPAPPRSPLLPPRNEDETPPVDPQRSGLEWREEWGRVQPFEYAWTATFGVLAFAGQRIKVKNREWSGNSFDDAIRDGIRLKSADDRTTARDVGEVLFLSLMAYPILIDTMLVVGPRNGDVAWQMFMVSVESMAMSGFATIMLERTLGRKRPFVERCGTDPDYAEDCASTAEDEHFQSFPSGHTVMGFAGAGLTCAHHGALPIYGGGAWDKAACVLALTGATAQGALRLASDRHYFTDVLAGAALGLGFGYGVPMLLHYGKEPRLAASAAPRVVLPYATTSELGVLATGMF